MTAPAARMPALFIGHGSPMNALETNRFTRVWQALGRALPRPRAVVVISAHWYIGTSAVTAMARPRTIHDFSGFPPALSAVQYPAPGAPGVAREVAAALAPTPVALDMRDWGLDHGAWSVLVHLYPAADVPVLQLAIDATLPLASHVALGARLAPLRERGVLLLGSGNVVHNLRAIDWQQPQGGAPWAERFEQAAIDRMTAAPASVATLAGHADFARTVPTPDHFIPLLYTAGMAQADDRVQTLLRGCTMGSLSMASFALHSGAGLDLPDQAA